MHLAFVAAEPDREQMHMPRAAESNITPCAAEQRNRVVFLELANGAERGVRGIVTGVRSGCQQNDVACAASQLVHGGKNAAAPSGPGALHQQSADPRESM